jgi:FkbM family methyltransferase
MTHPLLEFHAKVSLNLIDLGASGDSNPYWERLESVTNLFGFDPNREECERLNIKASRFRTHNFLPYAITGTTGEFTLHKTKSMYCWSLLQPNTSWLRRFQFGAEFEVEGTEAIPGVRLDDVKELNGVDIDVLKVDTQGLELPILKAGERLLRNTIMIETETGFVKNYIGETTFDELAAYMKARGFGLFHINSTRQQPRANALAAFGDNEELLWCEAIWFRDYKNPACQAVLQELTREKALKALCLYASHGCLSFGYEMAELFAGKGLLSASELQVLGSGPAAWRLPQVKRAPIQESRLRFLIRHIPRKFYSPMLYHLNDLKNTPHPFSKED